MLFFVAYLIAVGLFGISNANDKAMSFFVTSVGSGMGGDLGGIAGADAHCQTLATAVGAGNQQWHAYLSTEEDGTAYFPNDDDHTCNNWTSIDDGSAQVGHHDRHGGGNLSWTSAYGTRGCSMDDLAQTGGSSLFYCFAVHK